MFSYHPLLVIHPMAYGSRVSALLQWFLLPAFSSSSFVLDLRRRQPFQLCFLVVNSFFLWDNTRRVEQRWIGACCADLVDYCGWVCGCFQFEQWYSMVVAVDVTVLDFDFVLIFS
jgi:hypothetical protein